MRLGLACMLALVVALGAIPPTVIANGDHTRTGSGSIDGPGWVALGIDDSDGHLSIEIVAIASKAPLQLGVDVVDDRGNAMFLSTATVFQANDGLRVEAQAGDVEILHHHDDGDSRFFQIQLTYTVHLQSFPLSDARFVLWSAGPITDTSWALDAGQDATITETRTGLDTFLFVDDRFEGPLEFENTREKAVRTQVLASRTIDVDHTLVGVFDHGDNSTDHMTVSGPDGTRECPCTFADTGADAAGPGSYTFEATGIGTGDDRWIVLGGADVDLGG